MKHMIWVKRGVILVLTLAWLLVLTTPAPAAEKPWPKDIRLLGGAVGATFYVYATGFSPIIQKYVKIKTSSAAGYMTQDNVRMLRTGQADTIFGSNDGLRDAWNGTGAFTEKLRSLRGIAGSYGLATFAARADSGIKTPADLVGKKFIADLPTSTSVTAVKDSIIEQYELKGKVDIMKFTGHAAYVEAMKEKRADAVLVAGGIPTSSVVELTSEVECIIVPIDLDRAKAANMKRPDTILVTIPAGTYRGQNRDVLNLGWGNTWVTTTDLPESLVYEMTKAIFDHPKETKAVHPTAIDFTKEGKPFMGAVLPYHFGAVKYFKEVGIWTDELEAHQKMTLAEAGTPK